MTFTILVKVDLREGERGPNKFQETEAIWRLMQENLLAAPDPTGGAYSAPQTP